MESKPATQRIVQGKKYKVTLAIDPGGTTGCALRMSNGVLITCICSQPEELYDLLKEPALEQIVYERFQAQTISKYGLHTVRLVGAVEAIAYFRELPVKGHMPQDRRPFLIEARELLMGRRTTVHEQDATAHLLRWEHDNGYGK